MTLINTLEKHWIYVVVIIVMIIVITGYIYKNKSSKESYASLFFNDALNNQIYSRPTFNSNLDPNNPDLRFDPYVYGGFIKGVSPDVEMLAATNQDEGFSFKKNKPKENFYAMQNSTSNDFSSIGAPTDSQQQKVAAYKASLQTQKPNTLDYTIPDELLPTPDMRQINNSDPSDPNNFMFDRTIFAKLKRRNRNEVDFIRGDLDIEPIKTGYFDISTIPHNDLVKGYLGESRDIIETNDIQDVVYSMNREEASGRFNAAKASKNQLQTTIEQQVSQSLKPNMKYDTLPTNIANNNDNPWGNQRAFQL